MANQSIYNAFERMWSHILNALSGKADKVELNSLSEEVNKSSSTYETKTDSEEKFVKSKTYANELVAQKTQVQIVTWEADD
jgi:hypothetical protein